MRSFVRRGLGTVVTTALMLTAVAVLGTMIIIWSNGNLKNYETALSTTAANNTNKINENLIIENIAFCTKCPNNVPNTNDVINVTLTNTGTITVRIDKIQINSTVITSGVYGTTLPQNIFPKNSYMIAAQLPGSAIWKSKSVDTIIVTTHRGSTYTTQAVPP